MAGVLEGRDGITDRPEGAGGVLQDPLRLRVAKARTRGGYLKDIKGFDAEFFALAKMEADNIDPQQRMALELTWEALEYARIRPRRAVKASACSSAAPPTTTASWQWPTRRPPTRTPSPARRGSIIANRVSSSTTSAARRSPSTPHARVRGRRAPGCADAGDGEADVVLAGGSTLWATRLVTIGFDEVGGVLASDGRITRPRWCMSDVSRRLRRDCASLHSPWRTARMTSSPGPSSNRGLHPANRGAQRIAPYFGRHPSGRAALLSTRCERPDATGRRRLEP